MDQFPCTTISLRAATARSFFFHPLLNRLCAELRLSCSGGTTNTTAQAPGIECSATVPGACHLKRTSTMSDMSNTWNVTGVNMDSPQKYNGRYKELVIEARPAYGNRKQWKGEFRFSLTPEQIEDLKKTLDGESQKARLIEVAHSELEAIKND